MRPSVDEQGDLPRHRGATPGRDDAQKRRALGRFGEDLAAVWYASRGYEVVARNWSCSQGELDLVARRDRLYVFCEVKARTSDVFGLPAEAVGPAKQARIRRLAARWFAEARSRDVPASSAPSRSGTNSAARANTRRFDGGTARFDVVCVLAGQVEVFEGAF